MKMRTGYVVKEKGYEYNDNWYDHEPSQDSYTNLFDDKEAAIKYAKKFTADFISGRGIYDYFNGKPYVSKLSELVENHMFDTYDPESKEFAKIWDFIKDEIAHVLEAEILEGDPVIVHYSDGTKMYYKDGVLHRVGKPAIERGDGTWEYYYEGKKHRIDGPAIHSDYSDEGWYVEGKIYWDENEFKKAAGLWLQNHRDQQIDNVIG